MNNLTKTITKLQESGFEFLSSYENLKPSPETVYLFHKSNLVLRLIEHHQFNFTGIIGNAYLYGAFNYTEYTRTRINIRLPSFTGDLDYLEGGVWGIQRILMNRFLLGFESINREFEFLCSFNPLPIHEYAHKIRYWDELNPNMKLSDKFN